MSNNIILIGFMGVGKGSMARLLACEYKLYNIDTDDLIESKENKEIKKIFKKKGEKYFRKQEQLTADWIEANLKGTIVSCGGGFYTVKNLKELGTIVLLDAPFEWIYERLSTAKNAKAKLAKRPLFAKLEEAQALYNERLEAYRALADVTIDVDKLSQEEQLHTIGKACNLL